MCQQFLFDDLSYTSFMNGHFVTSVVILFFSSLGGVNTWSKKTDPVWGLRQRGGCRTRSAL